MTQGTRTGKEQPEEPEQDPDVIDADFREVENEPEPEAEAQEEPEALCETCAHKGECVGKKTHDDGCMGYEEEQELQEADPEQYTARDVEELLQKHEADLRAYREVGGMPERVMRKQRILVDALTLFLHEIEQREIDAEGGGEDD